MAILIVRIFSPSELLGEKEKGNRNEAKNGNEAVECDINIAGIPKKQKFPAFAKNPEAGIIPKKNILRKKNTIFLFLRKI